MYVISSLCCRRRSGVLFNARRLDICLKTTGSPTCVLELHTQTLVYVFIVCLKVFLSVWWYIGSRRCSVKFFLFFCLHRRSEEEVDMDKVTAAMVLTSLSTSPLVRSPPVKVNGQYHDYLTDAICLKLNSLKKKNSSVKPVICMFCFTFHSLTAVILWMHAEAQADKLPPPAVL